MAEKKTTKKEAPAKNYSTEGAAGKRAAAVIFWILAVICELAAIMNLSGKWYLPNVIPALPDNYLIYLIAFLVLDLVFLIIGSSFWKKANHIDPASEKNKLAFFLQNQMGLIMSIICFVPFIIMLLKNDKEGNLKLDKKTKNIVLVVSVVALVLGGLLSADFNPISEEEKTAAVAEHGTDEIYVTPYGHCYHYYDDCQSLTRATVLPVKEQDWYADDKTQIEQAISEGYTKLCSYCENRAKATE